MNTKQLNNIPIYRGLKVGTKDEYVYGFLSKNNEISFTESYFYCGASGLRTIKTVIDPETLAIHFPSWIIQDVETDSEVKAFASLQKDKKGGDEIEIRDNFVGATGTLYFDGNSLMFQDMKIEVETLIAFQVTGVQK